MEACGYPERDTKFKGPERGMGLVCTNNAKEAERPTEGIIENKDREAWWREAGLDCVQHCRLL